jgi:lipoate-protein ligase A
VNSFPRRAGQWEIDRESLSAQAAHDVDLLSTSGRKVRIFEPNAPAVVLGSTQRDDIVDAEFVAARGLEIARRHSGGGAVLVDESVVWIDFVIARDDPLWDDDIARSMQWLGRLWSSALAEVGIDAGVHRGPAVVSALARAICFCGIGHGEVVVDGRKAVGISQRRTRRGARFQSVLHTRRDDRLIDALHLSDRDDARIEYADAVYVCDRSRQSILDALIEQLSAQ